MSELTALLVGAGGMGRQWGRNLQVRPDVRIGGWVDLRHEQAAAAAAELRLTNLVVETDLERALAQVRPDFVVDVTVPAAHHDVTLAALAAGVPVLGEKPMADSLARAQAMVAAAERAGKLYMVSQNRRYDAGLRAFGELIRQELGPLGMLCSTFSIGPHFGGFRDEMSSPLLLDMSIHTFDAARYLTGADPLSVYCEEFNPPWSWYRGAACASAIFELEGGLRYTYQGSWCSAGLPTSWQADWRASGPRGSALWDGMGAPVAEVVVAPGGFIAQTERRPAPAVPPAPIGIAGSLDEFLQALRTGVTPMGECHDNIKSLAMVFAALESAASGRRVAVRW